MSLACAHSPLHPFSVPSHPRIQIDMSNIIDQAEKIIEANGFKDSECFAARPVPHVPNNPLRSDHAREGQARGCPAAH